MRKQETTNHRIAAYIRVSTDEQAENPEGSIKNQEERIRQTVRFKNQESPFGEIVDVFIDRARSGKDTNRPDLQRLLSAIRRKEISLLVVSELSRLSRSIKDFAQIWELMQASGCSFMSLRENFDTTTAAGEMVLYSVANIAQFERRQISERVTASIQARASRGLYNGGTLPIGYRLIPERPGYLQVEPDGAELVRTCFTTFNKFRSLSATAKALNAQGITIKRESQGGFIRRLGHFTCENLRRILSNESYVGILVYRSKGQLKEAKANWPAIIDEVTFRLAQNHLEKIVRRKPESASRYPFLLSGLIHCGCCGHHLAGKSAHGNGGKIPYYDHGWATKRQGCQLQKAFDCFPYRVQAKRLEPAVWSEIERLLTNPETAKTLFEEAKTIADRRAMGSNAVKAKQRLQVIEGQLELLAERLATLPARISPGPIYKQMERLESEKRQQQQKASEEKPIDRPAALSDFSSFVKSLGEFENADAQAKFKILQALVQKIETTPNGFRLHHYVGAEYFNGAGATPRPATRPTNISRSESGSNSLTIGVPTGIRTPVPTVKR